MTLWGCIILPGVQDDDYKRSNGKFKVLGDCRKWITENLYGRTWGAYELGLM